MTQQIITNHLRPRKHKCKKCKKKIETPIYVKICKRDNEYYHLSCYYKKLKHQISLVEGQLKEWDEDKKELEAKYMGDIRKEMSGEEK